MRDRLLMIDIATRRFKALSYKQFDENNLLQIVVYEQKKLIDISNYISTAYFELPSGKKYKIMGNIQNNTINILLADDVLSEHGQVDVEVELSNLDQIVTSFTFYLNVEKSIFKGDALDPNIEHTHLNKEVLDRITNDMVDAIELGIGSVNLNAYQMKRDNTLDTDDKTVVGAINELNEKIDNVSFDENVLNDYAKKVDVPTKTSQLTNDSNFLTNIPSQYITEEELENKGYLTEHQDISHLATKTYVQAEIEKAKLNGDGNDINLDNFVTKDELNKKANIEDIPVKTSQLINDSNFLTSVPSQYVTETELNSKGYAKTTEVPNKTSQLTNDSNFAVQPNFTYKINMISINESPSVVTTGTYPNLVITFNIPMGTVPVNPDEEPKTEKMWIGWIPYEATGATGFNTLEQIGADITMKEIQFGLNNSSMQEMEPQTLGKTSTGIVPGSCYICCIFPKSSGYTITIDNGIGGKETFNERHGDYPVNNLPLKTQIDGFDYLVSGFLTNMQGERFLYVD